MESHCYPSATRLANALFRVTMVPMTHIDSIASKEDFLAHIAEGWITARKHQDDAVPYVIYDYTPKTANARKWNPVTVASRGLIVNYLTGEIVARPFAKFFNYGEAVSGVEDFSTAGAVSVTEKMDGSMGILYRLPNGEWAISTRGSMHSEQAAHATALYRKMYDGKWTPRDDVTYVFEIIYPENRIVLDYGATDDIVLIGAIIKETGKSLVVNEEVGEWWWNTAPSYPFASFTDALSATVADDREGFVVHFLDSDQRLKIKGAEYVRLHSIILGVTPLSVWTRLSERHDIESWLEDVPTEFSDLIEATADILIAKRDAICEKALTKALVITDRLAQTTQPIPRIEVAAHAKSLADSPTELGMIFAWIDAHTKLFYEAPWALIRPHGKLALREFVESHAEKM